jgi:integrase
VTTGVTIFKDSHSPPDQGTTPMGKFTDATIRGLKPKAKPYKLYEKGADVGFHVQVLRSGKSVFYLAYSFEGKKRFFNLGTYSSEFGLKQARSACREAQALLDSGIDPQNERKRIIREEGEERKRIEAERRATTVNEALDYYLTTLRDQTAHEVDNVFTNSHCNIRKRIGSVKLREITDEDIDELLAVHVKRGRLRSAGKLYAFLRSAFNKSQKNKEFKLKKWENPFRYVEKPEASDSNAIERSLAEEEIKWFLSALERSPMEKGVKDVLRIVLFTGQRVEQVSRMQWGHVDLSKKVWDAPPSETKTGKRTKTGHVVPLTDSVIHLLESQHREGALIFPGYREGKPFSIGLFSKNLKTMIAVEAENGVAVNPFTPRDLRRTATTHWVSLGIRHEIRNRIQNHALKGDVESTHYNRFDYTAQKRSALEKWEREIQRIIEEGAGA